MDKELKERLDFLGYDSLMRQASNSGYDNVGVLEPYFYREIENEFPETNMSEQDKRIEHLEYYNNMKKAKTFFSKDKKKSWYKGLKAESELYTILKSYEGYLNYLKVSFNDVANLLASLVNTDIYEGQIPTRYLCDRCHMSRETVQQIMDFLRRLDIKLVKLYSKDFEDWYKIDIKRLKRDPYFKKKAKRRRKQDIRVRNYLLEKYGMLAYEPYSRRTMSTKFLQYGITFGLATTEIFEPYLRTEARQKYIEEHGEREDILYIDVDFEMLARLTGMTPQAWSYKFNYWCKHTSFIKHHNKTYIDGSVEEHYYNRNYIAQGIFSNLVDLKDAKQEEGKAEYSFCSFIIFPDELAKHKKLSEFINNYKEDVKTQIVKAYKYKEFKNKDVLNFLKHNVVPGKKNFLNILYSLNPLEVPDKDMQEIQEIYRPSEYDEMDYNSTHIINKYYIKDGRKYLNKAYKEKNTKKYKPVSIKIIDKLGEDLVGLIYLAKDLKDNILDINNKICSYKLKCFKYLQEKIINLINLLEERGCIKLLQKARYLLNKFDLEFFYTI